MGLDLNSCILGGSGRFFCIGENGQRAIGFQNGKLHLTDVQHVLCPQMPHQLIQRNSGLTQLLLQNHPVVNQDNRLSAQQPAKGCVAQRPPAEHQLHPQHREDGHQPGKERNAPILHGDGSQVCHQHGHNKFRRCHLPNLPLAHEPYDQNQHQI